MSLSARRFEVCSCACQPGGRHSPGGSIHSGSCAGALATLCPPAFLWGFTPALIRRRIRMHDDTPHPPACQVNRLELLLSIASFAAALGALVASIFG